MKNKEKQITYREAFRRTWRGWKIWHRLCPGLALSGVLLSAFRAATPYVTIWLSAQIVTELAGARNPAALRNWVFLLLGSSALLMLIEGILKHWHDYKQSCAYAAYNLINMDKMMDLDYVDFDSQYVADLNSQIEQNRNWGGWGMANLLWKLQEQCTSLFKILGGIGLSVTLFLHPVPVGSPLAFLNHPLCVAAALALMLATTFLAPIFANKAALAITRAADTYKFGNRIANFFGYLSEDTKRALDLRMYPQREVSRCYLRMENPFARGTIMDRQAWGQVGLLNALSTAISMVLTGVIYLFVCLKAWAGAFGVGAVTQYVGAVTALFLGLSDFLRALGELRSNAEFLGTTFELLDIPNKMYQGSLTTEKRSDRQYDIEFRDVSFRYPDTEVWALRHVNMKFKVGARLAVVGENGSGKTTFIKLLCRLYDPTEGEILLIGINIQKFRYDDYLIFFSVVFQDFQLMALPLGENVAGSSSYDRKRAEHCLEQAGFGERLRDLPQGLDTYLYREMEEDGVQVSGGEAQKIAIARALYKDAPFIILDEPTAALDPITEAEIYSKFDEIAGDKTAIYISHRLSSCKFCDEIAVFDGGTLMQQGGHEELLGEEGGKYAKLWNAQAQYYVKQ